MSHLTLLQLVTRESFGDGGAADRARDDAALLLVLERLVLVVRPGSVPREDNLVRIGEGEGWIGGRADAEAYSFACQSYRPGLEQPVTDRYIVLYTEKT